MQAPPAWVMTTMAKLPPAQQQVQELLMRVMKDMFLPALATVPAAWALAYVPRFIKLGIIYGRSSTTDSNDRDPRSNPDEFGTSAGLVRRCFACHVNGLESFPAFAAAVLLCKIQKVKPFEAFGLCFRYIAARTLYTICYLSSGNGVMAAVRSIIWIDSILSIFRLYAKALTVSKPAK